MPRAQVESELQNLWMEILGTAPMGVRQDFFELGGDSVHAAQLRVRMEVLLGVPLNPTIVFGYNPRYGCPA